MKRVILDTSFILTCIKQKIDFFKELSEEGMEIIIPKQVIQEIENISESKGKKQHFRHDAKIALHLLKKEEYTPYLFEGSSVDRELILYGRENPEVIIATLDEEIKKKTKNQNLVIRGKKRLEVI